VFDDDAPARALPHAGEPQERAIVVTMAPSGSRAGTYHARR
jgi:hypothetical protein